MADAKLNALSPLPVRASELVPRYAEAGPLLELDALLGALVTAVQDHTRAGGADDLAGVEEVKAVQQHVRRMVRGGVVPDVVPPTCACGDPQRAGWTHRRGWCNEGGRAEFEAGPPEVGGPEHG